MRHFEHPPHFGEEVLSLRPNFHFLKKISPNQRSKSFVAMLSAHRLFFEGKASAAVTQWSSRVPSSGAGDLCACLDQASEPPSTAIPGLWGMVSISRFDCRCARYHDRYLPCKRVFKPFVDEYPPSSIFRNCSSQGNPYVNANHSAKQTASPGP